MEYEKKEDDHYRSELLEIVPYDTTRPYDIKKVVNEIVDEGSFFEIHKDFAKNIVVGFARINGQSVVLICSQPKYMAVRNVIYSTDKSHTSVRFCDSFNVSLHT